METIERWIGNIYRHLHRNPELGGHEAQTQSYLSDKLEELGIPVTVYEGQHALVGLIQGAYPGVTAAVRAEMDALPIMERTGLSYASAYPGIMHACGHDAHMAIVLGAARLLMEDRHNMRGNVKLLFEPDEEVIGGGKDMVAAGCLENPHVAGVLSLHMNPAFDTGVVYSKAGPVSGMSTDIHITVTGKSCHAAYPERGVDAVLIAAQIIVSLQTIVSRSVSPFDNAVLSMGEIHGGTASNIVCGSVLLHGTLRVLYPEQEACLREKITVMCRSVASAFGGTADVAFASGYRSVCNDPVLHGYLERRAGTLITRPAPSLGVESFCFFINNIPGLHYDLGCGIGSPIHTDTFQIDETVLMTGARLQAQLLNDILDGGI